MKAILLALSFMLLGAPSPIVRYVPVGRADSLAIEVSLPEHWVLSRRHLNDLFYDDRAVVFAANDRNDDSLTVAITRKDLPDGGKQFTFGPESFQAALKPGTVYVEVGYLEGGPHPISTPYAWADEDNPATAIERGLRDPDEHWTSKDVTIWRTTFVHWGMSWQAFVAARSPYSQQDIDRAFLMLRSLRFPDVPVGHELQAAEVAIPALPADFRAQFLPDPKCGCCRRYTVETASIENGFHVTFNLMDSETGRLLRSESVDVYRDGRATRR